MENGRIETQGTIKELKARGILDTITSEAEAQIAEEQGAKEERTDEAEKVAEEVVADMQKTQDSPGNSKEPKTKKPRKLIEEEERQTGSVKWNIYKTYLKAS